MDKKGIHHYLFTYTQTEKYYLHQGDDPFDLQENERISFEKNLRHVLKKNEKLASFLQDSQFLIVKHARFSAMPPHSHDYIEMCYVYSGKIEMVINGEQVTLHQGDFCLLDTDVIHQIMLTGKEDILINFLIKKEYFTTKVLSQIAHNNTLTKFAIDALSADQKHNQFIVFETVNNEFIDDAVMGMLSHYLDPSPFSREVIDTYMIVLFSELLRSFHEKKAKYYQQNKQLYIGDILSHIEKTQGQCSLQDLSAEFNFNSNYLSRFIKKQMGRSFMELVQEIRLNHGQTLLRTTDLPIETIIQQVGYRNINFFYQKFQEAYRESPKEYRQRFRQVDASRTQN